LVFIPIQWVPGNPFAGVKRPEREVDYTSPASAEVKNDRIYTSIPTVRRHGA